MRHIAFLTMEDPGDFQIYDHLLHEPLRRRGVEVHDVPWSRPAVDWNRFELVVIRWPWDYWHRLEEFLQVLKVIEASSADLHNSLATVTWNINKSYLRDLQQRGVTIVPTQWLNRPTSQQLVELFDSLNCNELVVKPIVGAGADGAFRLRRDSPQQLVQDAEQYYRTRDALAQPLIPSVIDPGEYSLIYFSNQFSHAILKTPRSGDFRVQEEFGGQIQRVTPENDLIAFGEKTLAALDVVPLYSRVDIVRLPDGRPALMEIELIEPSLYFPYDPQSADRMADAIVAQLQSGIAQRDAGVGVGQQLGQSR